MTVTYPSFPTTGIGVVQMAYGRDKVWPTVIQKAASGKEMRAQFVSAGLAGFTVKIVARRSIPNAYHLNEVATLQAFFDQMQGPLLPFWFTDIQDNVPRLCRFTDDTLKWDRSEASTEWWETTLGIQEVLP